jgi:hypothetical protein
MNAKLAILSTDQLKQRPELKTRQDAVENVSENVKLSSKVAKTIRRTVQCLLGTF